MPLLKYTGFISPVRSAHFRVPIENEFPTENFVPKANQRLHGRSYYKYYTQLMRVVSVRELLRLWNIMLLGSLGLEVCIAFTMQ